MLAAVSPIVMLLFAFVDLKVSSISVPYFHWPTLLKYLYWLDSEPLEYRIFITTKTPLSQLSG